MQNLVNLDLEYKSIITFSVANIASINFSISNDNVIVIRELAAVH